MPNNSMQPTANASAELPDGADATRLAIGAADDHPLSVPALTRQAIKRLQRTAAPAGKLECSSAADPQRRSPALRSGERGRGSGIRLSARRRANKRLEQTLRVVK